MTNSNQKAYQIVLEIILLIAFIIISYFVWNQSHMESYSSIAKRYKNHSNIAFDMEGKMNSDLLFPITEKEAKEQQAATLKIKSLGNNTTATLALQIAKTSSLDFHYLNILLDNQVIFLKDSNLFEDADYYYIPIIQEEVTNEIKEHRIYLYLNQNAGNDTQNKSIEIDIVSVESEIV